MAHLAYGYMRALADMSDEEVTAKEDGIRDFAQRKGFVLVEIFQETDTCTQAAFNALIRQLQSPGAMSLVIPSMNDLSRSLPLQNSMLVRLEAATGVDVHDLEEET